MKRPGICARTCTRTNELYKLFLPIYLLKLGLFLDFEMHRFHVFPNEIL